MQAFFKKYGVYSIFVLSVFLSVFGGNFAAFAAEDEPWAEIEARTKPIKANRRVEAKRIKSTFKKYSIPFKVMLPADYETSGKRYPVVLLLCGASGCRRGAGSEPLYFSVWCKWPRLMDNLSHQTLTKKNFEYMISEKELKAFNEKLAANQFEDYISVDLWHPSASRDVEFDKFILEELFPFLDENYRTIPHPKFRAIDGACGGGAAALFIAFRNPEAFAGAGGMQTDLGTYPHALKCFEENEAKIGASGIKFNLNTNKNDVCNSYYFDTRKDGSGQKIKVPSGELAKLSIMMENAGCSVEVNVFNSCSHGYSAYRYPNGHQTMYFYSCLFKENREKYPDAINQAEKKAAAASPDNGASLEVELKKRLDKVKTI